MRLTHGLRSFVTAPVLAVAVAVGIFQLSSCSERWQGFVYPKRENLGNVLDAGTYSSLPECRQAAKAMLEALHATTGDYECGKNCQAPDSNGLRVCDETSR
jgi:hypothetical protein